MNSSKSLNDVSTAEVHKYTKHAKAGQSWDMWSHSHNLETLGLRQMQCGDELSHWST